MTDKNSAPSLEKKAWGGAREGAGRPKSSVFVSHNRRPRLDHAHIPVKIVFRLRSGLPSLISDNLYSVFHRACLRARGAGLRISHYALTESKITFICEFKSQVELEKALKSLGTTLAIAIKKEVKRLNPEEPHKGPVFLGRFIMELLDSHAEYQVALKELYLPTGVEKNAELIQKLEYSSAVLFRKWNALFNDENTETKNFIRECRDHLNQASELPQRRLATEITSSPIFDLSKTWALE